MITSNEVKSAISARPAMRPPKASIPPDQVRQVELSQLERRYRSSFRTVRTTSESTVVRLAIVPSDPDFPFELEALQLQLDIPANYPDKHCSVKVMNPDIPPGFAFHLEQGYQVYASKRTNTLVRQMAWMDKNMEILLQEPPAPTVKFVSNATHQDTLSKGLSSLEIGSSSVDSRPKTPEHPEPQIPLGKPIDTPDMTFTNDQIEQASKKREQELRQLQARFRSTYNVLECNKEHTIVEIKIPLTDPDFVYSQTFGNELKVNYIIPNLYPLVPCSVEIKNDTEYKRAIKDTFCDYVQDGSHSLFSNLNWLNQHLSAILSKPVPAYTPPATVQPTPVSSPVVPGHVKEQNKSLFDDQEKPNRVIIVNRPFIPNTSINEHPEESNEHTANNATSTNSTNESSTDGESEEEKKAALPATGPAPRRGTLIRLIEPRLENVSLFYCLSLHLIVKCARCKSTVEVENLTPEQVSLGDKQQGKERWMTCSTCSSILGAKFLGEFMHENATSVGCLQLAGCTPFDVLPSSFIGTCAKCMDDMRSPVRIAPNDQPASVHCFGCHAKMTICLGDFKFVQVGEGGDRLKASEQQVMKLKLKKKRVKEELLTIGQPLPDQGTCHHYRKSKRWFRFSCCNKLYKCDHCHDRQEDHECEMAKRHVCGLCSREQAIGPKPCVCGHDFGRDNQKSSFWEGGQGTRNREAMNRKDSHKYKGKAKVTSKKQERVGVAGKEKYQPKKPSEQN